MKKWLDIIVGGVISLGLVGIILKFCLQLFSNHLSEKKRIKGNFLEIKNSIHNTTIANNLFPELSKLKRFFVRYPKFLKKPANNYFFQKWLMHPLVEEEFRGSGFWDEKRIREMITDLDKMKI